MPQACIFVQPMGSRLPVTRHVTTSPRSCGERHSGTDHHQHEQNTSKGCLYPSLHALGIPGPTKQQRKPRRSHLESLQQLDHAVQHLDAFASLGAVLLYTLPGSLDR